MQLTQTIFKLFWVPFCALSLMAQTRLLLGMSLSLDWMDGFVFGGTVFGYHCTHPNRRYRMIAWGAGYLGGICFLIQLINSPGSLWRHLIALAPMLFWLAYYGFQRPGIAGLRGRPLAKPITIALTWAWVTVLLPTPFGQWADALLVLLGRAAFVFALALAYDLSDTEYDHRQGLNTLTLQLGMERSFRLIYISLALSALCVGANLYCQRYEWSAGLGLFISLILSAFWLRYVLRSKTWESWQKPAIDGLMVLQFGMVMLFGFLS